MLAKINLASIDVLENLRKLQKALFGAEAHSRRAVEGGVQVEERQKLPRPEAVTKLITNERQRRGRTRAPGKHDSNLNYPHRCGGLIET